MHDKQNGDSYPTIIKTKKKGIMERKPPNDKIIFYKFTKTEEADETKTEENNGT